MLGRDCRLSDHIVRVCSRPGSPPFSTFPFFLNLNLHWLLTPTATLDNALAGALHGCPFLLLILSLSNTPTQHRTHTQNGREEKREREKERKRKRREGRGVERSINTHVYLPGRVRATTKGSILFTIATSFKSSPLDGKSQKAHAHTHASTHKHTRL